MSIVENESRENLKILSVKLQYKRKGKRSLYNSSLIYQNGKLPFTGEYNIICLLKINNRGKDLVARHSVVDSELTRYSSKERNNRILKTKFTFL